MSLHNRCKTRSLFLLLLCVGLLPVTGNADTTATLLERAVAGDHRDPDNVARDRYRHPVETLQFFGWQPDMTVVEIWPGGGWYTEILAPITREQGILYVAGFSMTADRTPDWRKKYHKQYTDKLAQRPDVYDHVVVTELSVPERTTIAPPGSVDMILTFRNVHNWMKGEYAEQMFQVFARIIKPGGILGVTEHRARPGTDLATMIKSGYVTEEHVIKLAQQAGFKLEAKGDINANPDDTTDHPKGVWTLPPTLRYCKNLEQGVDECMQQYRAIGESDRMTLKFVKQ